MQTYRYVVADVFTDTPLTGNQLAVFTDARTLDDAMMQALALEVGVSETALVFAPENGGNVKIRIFTPTFELPFAGHPTLGTAFVLGAPLQLDVITLETRRRNAPGRRRRGRAAAEARARRSGPHRLRADGAARARDRAAPRSAGCMRRARRRRLGA